MPNEDRTRSTRAGRQDRQRTLFALDQPGRRLSDDGTMVVAKTLEERAIEGPTGEEYVLIAVSETDAARAEAVGRLLTGETTGYAPERPVHLVTAEVVYDRERIVELEHGTLARALLVPSDDHHRSTITWLPLLVESNEADAVLVPTGEAGQHLLLVRRSALGVTVFLRDERSAVLQPLRDPARRDVAARRVLVRAILARIGAGLLTSALAGLAKWLGF
jgi:hypothetical protein